MSGIGDHRFIFQIELLPNYTFYTNLTTLSIGYLAYRRCDKPDDVQFMKSWEKYAESFDAGLKSFYELSGRFMDAVDGLEREGHSRTSTQLKIPRRPSRSEIGRSNNVHKTRWTFYERNCRTSDQLGTHNNVLPSSISYSSCARRPRAFLLRWSRSHTDPTRPYCDRNHFYSD